MIGRQTGREALGYKGQRTMIYISAGQSLYSRNHGQAVNLLLCPSHEAVGYIGEHCPEDSIFYGSVAIDHKSVAL